MRVLKMFLFAATVLAGMPPLPAEAQGTSRTLNDDLLYRISFGRKDDVNDLLQKGAETNIYGTMGDTPLILAITRKSSEGDEIMKELVVKGADPNFPDRNGIYPLEAAIKSDRETAVRILVDAGGDIRMKSQNGMTMAELAAKRGKPEVNAIISETFQKQVEKEAQLRNPQRLPVMMQHFAMEVCNYSYWSNYLLSEQNPQDNESSRQKIAKSKETAEKLGGEIAYYFPNVNLNSYMTYSATTITNAFKAFPSNKARKENGFGTDNDAREKCRTIAETSRDSVSKVLDEQKKAADAAAHQTELMR